MHLITPKQVVFTISENVQSVHLVDRRQDVHISMCQCVGGICNLQVQCTLLLPVWCVCLCKCECISVNSMIKSHHYQ